MLNSPHQHRFLEILPGFLTWTTLLGAPILSYYHPAWVAIYIILFDLYWFLKGANVAIHLVHSYRELKLYQMIDWLEMLRQFNDPVQFKSFIREQILKTNSQKLIRIYERQLARGQLAEGRNRDWQKVYHLMVLAAVDEGLDVLEPSVASYADADYDTSKVFFVLALELRAGPAAYGRALILKEKYEKKFGLFLITQHPDDLPGEIKGKAGNMNFAIQAALPILAERRIATEQVLISAFDSDTIVHRNYFAHLTYDFLTAHKPLQTSFQPLPFYHNNIWDTPAVARVIAVSSSFWQLIEASRPDRMVTFASHAMSLKTLIDVGLFMKDSTNEDSFIFWQCFQHFNGDYRNQPVFTTVSMDAVMGSSFTDTMLAQYKQKRRWAYGVTQITFVLSDIWRNEKVPLWKRLLYAERFVEGHYFWATGSIMLAVLGWLPLIMGGDRFGSTVLALNLPVLTKGIMSIATFFLAFSVYINFVMLPPRPKGYSRWKTVSMLWQWIFSPVVASLFGSLPAIDAQTRLMLGKYMESFWVTPKIRKPSVPSASPVSEVLLK